MDARGWGDCPGTQHARPGADGERPGSRPDSGEDGHKRQTAAADVEHVLAGEYRQQGHEGRPQDDHEEDQAQKQPQTFVPSDVAHGRHHLLDQGFPTAGMGYAG